MNHESIYYKLTDELVRDCKACLETGKCGDELDRVIHYLIDTSKINDVVARAILNLPSAGLIKAAAYSDDYVQKVLDDELESVALNRGKAKYYNEKYGDAI